MRMTMLAGCAVLCASLLTANGAMAAQAKHWDGKTCAEFTKMEPGAQDHFVESHQAKTPDASLSTDTGSTSANQEKAEQAAGADGSYSSGQLVAACQAASPESSLDDALSQSVTPSGK